MRKEKQKRLVHRAPLIFVAAVLVLLPLFLPSYLQDLMTSILIFAIFAMSLDLIFGYTGLISLGHAAYLGVAGYTTGLLMARYGIHSFWITAPCGILMGALTAALFGIIALRATGIYFMLVTFALGQLLFSIAIKWRFLTTGGTEGVTGIVRPDLGIPGFKWDALLFYYFVFLCFILCYLLLHRLVKSPLGHALQGIRENELRILALGYHSWFYKYLAFVIGGTFAGAAGVLFVYHNGIIVPANLGVLTSGTAIFMVIIGGIGTLHGAVVGAAVIVLLQFFVSDFALERWPLIMGSTFVATMLFARAGLSVYIWKTWKKAVGPYGSDPF
jgi:branched-chain amino acid transport system permease protein